MLEVLGRTFLHGVYGDPKDWGWDWAVSPASGISGVFLLAAQGSRLSRARLAFLHFNGSGLRFGASFKDLDSEVRGSASTSLRVTAPKPADSYGPASEPKPTS